DAVARHLEPLSIAEDAYMAAHPGAPMSVLVDLQRDWLREHPAPPTNVGHVADHIDHLRAVMGVDHVGIGSDFDGGALVPDDLQDVSQFPNLLGELLRRGYTDDEIRAIAGANILRVMRGAEAVSARLAAT